MREALVPKRSLPAWLALLLILPSLPPAQAASEQGWTVLVRDDASDAAMAGPGGIPSLDPRLDLLDVSLAEDEGSLWVRLRTGGSDLGSALPSFGGPEPVSMVQATILRAGDGSRHELRLLAKGNALSVLVDGDLTTVVPLDPAEGQAAWGYEVALSRWDFFGDAPLEIGDRLHEPWATVEADAGGLIIGGADRGPSAGFGETYVVQEATGSPDPLPAWAESETVDYAAGPSVAVGADQRAHVAYIVYNSDRGTPTGLYHATFDASRPATGEPPGWRAERVADATMPAPLHQDHKTQTAIAVDSRDRPHVVFHPAPNSGRGEIRYATSSGDGWRVEDPARLADGARLSVDDSYRGPPAVVAGAGRVLVAFQSGADVALVERTGADSWRLETRIPDARFPRLALDGDGSAHLAWFGGGRRTGDVSVGTLRYANEATAWKAADVVAGVQDYSAFWETSETDGSFAFALDAAGTPHFVWDADGEQGFGAWRDGVLDREPAPLTPGHGNPQVRIRMAIDAEGRAHVLSGYGGTDIYAIRSAEGDWSREEVPRQDMAQLVLTPDGRALVASTQPHGGTTLGFRTQASRPASPEETSLATSSHEADPSVSPSVALLALSALAGSLVGWLALARLRGFLLPPWWQALALVGGFSRIARPDLAEHQAREAILRAARDDPGVSATELRRRLEMPRSTFFYHVHRLSKERLLVTRRQGKHLLLHMPGVRLEEKAVLAPGARRLLDTVRAAPARTTMEYAGLADLPRRTVADHLAALERAGLVVPAPGVLRPRRWRAV